MAIALKISKTIEKDKIWLTEGGGRQRDNYNSFERDFRKILNVVIKAGYHIWHIRHGLNILILLQEKFCLQKVPAGGKRWTVRNFLLYDTVFYCVA